MTVIIKKEKHLYTYSLNWIKKSKWPVIQTCQTLFVLLGSV